MILNDLHIHFGNSMKFNWISFKHVFKMNEIVLNKENGH